MKKLLIAGMVAIAPMAFAEVDAEKNWHGEGDLAYNKASGNSESEALLTKLKLVYEQKRWTHTGQVEAINTSENDERSAESYVLKAKSDFAISEANYAFGTGRYEDNRFSGYEYQTSLAVGLGRHIIDTDVAKFDLEAGVGYRISEEQDTGEQLNETIVIGSARYHRVLTETTRFESDLNVESGKDNTYAEAVVGLKVKINSRLALKVAYTAKHNTDVPAGTENTDTLTSVGLNYNF